MAPAAPLVKDRVAAQNRDHTHRSALLERQARERLRQIERQIAALEAALHAELAADPALKARFDILVSIPGVGEATAFAMLIEMPELGALEHKCAASLAGLAPIARDSGQHRGKRFIRGGRAPLRQALYMPALVAVRFNATMKAKYHTLLAAGKPPKGGARRDHAKAPHPRQRSHPRRPHLDPKSRLIKTDTLEATVELERHGVVRSGLGVVVRLHPGQPVQAEIAHARQADAIADLQIQLASLRRQGRADRAGAGSDRRGFGRAVGRARHPQPRPGAVARSPRSADRPRSASSRRARPSPKLLLYSIDRSRRRPCPSPPARVSPRFACAEQRRGAR